MYRSEMETIGSISFYQTDEGWYYLVRAGADSSIATLFKRNNGRLWLWYVSKSLWSDPRLYYSKRKGVQVSDYDLVAILSVRKVKCDATA